MIILRLPKNEFLKTQEIFSGDTSGILSIIDTMSNQIQKDIFTEMVNILDDSRSYEEVLDEINLLKEYTRENLTCLEKFSTLVALEVYANSAKLWLPTELGGEGYYDEASDALTNGAGLRRSKFWRIFGVVVASDAVGAFTGFVRAAGPYFISGGPANPISNGALLLGAGGQAVGSSATSFIGQMSNK